jgi:hypothetical protein
MLDSVFLDRNYGGKISLMAHKLAVAIILLCVSSAVAQTPSEFETKYGKPVVVYQVSEHIWMTPEYTTDGQVCMMRLHPRRFAPNVNYITPNLPFEELKRVLNHLVPLHTRGAKKEPFDTGAAGGGVDWMSYVYENVKFTFGASFRPDPDSWKTRKEYIFSTNPDPAPAQQPKPKNSTPSDNDFSSSRFMSTEIVTIKWNGRQCAKQ